MLHIPVDLPHRFAASSLALGLALVFAVGPAGAFHDGGVASCSGCHVMHESQDGSWVPASDGNLLGPSPSDTCLLCHATSNGAVFGPSPLAPGVERGGGNFVFLLEDQINDAPDGASAPIAGEAAGHSIVAPGQGLGPDSRWSTSPGGNFPSAELGCTSCHDPHGRQTFRMLYGAGPVQGDLYSFSANAPQAEGLPLDGPGESRTQHTAYQGGWSQWCGNCHGANYHDASTNGFEHPSQRGLDQDIVLWYNAYAGDVDPTGGLRETAYLPEVPILDPSVTVSSTAGPTAWSRISCMTCHRAHATSSPAAGRWDFHVSALGQDGAVSGSYPIPNPYGANQQRQLCVKCHDPGGHDQGRACLRCHASGNR